MRIMIAGGGTAGHVFPALAVLEELQKRDPRLVVQWVGRRGGPEERVCAKHSIPFRALSVEGWPRRHTWRKFWAAAKFAWATGRSFSLIKRFRPQVVFGLGGYVSLPVVYIAERLRVPTVVHEQNRTLGMANRILASRATRILLTYPDSQPDSLQEKSVLVGNPVRPCFTNPPTKIEARAAFELDGSVPVVLVVGGSQGAHTLNKAVMEALGHFRENEVQLLWMTGRADADTAASAAPNAPILVKVFPFIEDMAAACAAAELVVGRAGASILAELAAIGKPSVLVPYPHATDNHQRQNARPFEDAGAAVIVPDSECTGQRFLEIVRELLSDSARLAQMSRAARSLARPDAAETIAELLLSFAVESPS